MISESAESSYLRHLPALFQERPAEGPSFLGRFLLAFEQVLSGLGDPRRPGLEERIERIHDLFDPDLTPAELLPWLAGWVGLTLREDWEETRRRRFLARIVPLYRTRGTQRGLAELLQAYTGLGVEISEDDARPHFFSVEMSLSTRDPAGLAALERTAREIIAREKPAHTYFDLRVLVPTLQIGVHSTVGRDTLLGIPPS